MLFKVNDESNQYKVSRTHRLACILTIAKTSSIQKTDLPGHFGLFVAIFAKAKVYLKRYCSRWVKLLTCQRTVNEAPIICSTLCV